MSIRLRQKVSYIINMLIYVVNNNNNHASFLDQSRIQYETKYEVKDIMYKR